MGRLSLRQLEVFRAIMRSGSLTSAAAALGVTQPAATRLLRHAEDQLGMVLFERTHGRLRATDEARALYPEVERIFGDLDYVERAAEDLRRLQAGRLRIAAIPSLAITVVAKAVGQFVRDHPAVTISTATVLNFDVPELVLDRRADIGLAFAPIPDNDLEVDEICRVRIVAVLPPGHPLTSLSSVAPSDLAGATVVSFSTSLAIGQLIESAFRSAGIHQPMTLEVGNSFVACAYVRAGAGIALVDSLAVDSGAFPDLVSRPMSPILEMSAVLVRRGLQQSLLAAAFQDELRSSARATVPGGSQQ
jgi:DNA-binding transcriptional LysR family regulator